MADLSKDEKWELSDIPDLLNEILYLCDRLDGEQHNAIDLLGACKRGWYKEECFMDEERSRLRGNIKALEKKKKLYQDALVDFGKEQIKKDELK